MLGRRAPQSSWRAATAAAAARYGEVGGGRSSKGHVEGEGRGSSGQMCVVWWVAWEVPGEGVGSWHEG